MSMCLCLLLGADLCLLLALPPWLSKPFSYMIVDQKHRCMQVMRNEATRLNAQMRSCGIES